MDIMSRFPKSSCFGIKRFALVITTLLIVQFAFSKPSKTDTIALNNDIGLVAVFPQSPVCEGLNPIKFVVRNFGTSSIDSANIQWSINGVNQPVYLWSKTGGLASGLTDTAIITSYNLASGNTTIFGSISYSNGTIDSNLLNNSILSSIQVMASPHILIQPTNTLSEIGANATFQVQVSGTGILFQWQVSTNDGTTWANIPNAAPYSNTSTNTLTITSVTNDMLGYQYRCIVTDTCNGFEVSNAVVLLVGDPIKVTAGTVYGCGGNAVLIPITIENVVEISSFKLTLNYNSAQIPFNTFLSLNPALADGTWSTSASGGKITMSWSSSIPVSIDTGKLCDLQFTYAYGVHNISWDINTSGNCFFQTVAGVDFAANYVNGIILNGNSSITHQPSPVGTSINGTAKFHIACSGAPAYQWQRSTNGGGTWVNLTVGNIPGGGNANTQNVTSDTLKIFLCQTVLNLNQFRCIVTGCSNTIISNSAQLQVIKKVITKVDSIRKCINDIVIVPLKVWNFDSIGSISLKLEYSTSSLEFLGYQNAISPPGLTLVNANLGAVFMATFGMINLSAPDGSTMVEFRFRYLGGCSYLRWDTITPGQCEYSNQITVLPSTFYNGAVCDSTPSTAGNIAGPVTLGQGTNNVMFTVGPITRASSYIWTIPAGATIVSGDGTNSIIVNFGLTAVSGTISVSGQNSCGAGQASNLFVNILSNSSTIQGTQTYDNSYSTPLSNCQVTLTGNGNSWVVSTDNNGHFEFDQLDAGTYTLVPSCTKPWGGVNAADALLILKHFVGAITLQNLRLQAADVDGSGFVNSTDALVISKRFVQIINSFVPGDWLFRTETITINGTSSITSNLKAICYGDVDGSFVPPAK